MIKGLLFGVGVGAGVAVGLGVGVGVPVGVGVGVGVGDVHALPSKLPGFVVVGPAAQVPTGYAFDANAIQRPSELMTGRLLIISTRVFKTDGVPKWSFRTLFVFVI